MQVLNKNRKMLTYFGLGISEDVRIFNKNITRKVVQFTFILGLTLGLLMSGLLVVTKYNSEPLVAILMPMCTLLTYLSEMLVYISLLIKIQRISQLFDYIQNLVDASKLPSA